MIVQIRLRVSQVHNHIDQTSFFFLNEILEYIVIRRYIIIIMNVVMILFTSNLGSEKSIWYACDIYGIWRYKLFLLVIIIQRHICSLLHPWRIISINHRREKKTCSALWKHEIDLNWYSFIHFLIWILRMLLHPTTYRPARHCGSKRIAARIELCIVRPASDFCRYPPANEKIMHCYLSTWRHFALLHTFVKIRLTPPCNSASLSYASSSSLQRAHRFE